MFRLHIKMFIKNPITALSYVFYVALLVYILIHNRELSAVASFQLCMKTIEMNFLYFLFLSYFCFRRITDSKVGEVLQCDSNSGAETWLSQGLLLFLLMLVVCAILSGYQFMMAGRQGNLPDGYTDFLLKGILYYHFLIYCFAILSGGLLSTIQSKARAYGFLIAEYIVFGKICISYLHRFFYDSNLAYRLIDLLSLYTREYDAMTDYYYVFSMEMVNLQRILCWIFLVVALIFFRSGLRYRFFYGSTMAIACGLCFWFFMLPTSAVNLDSDFSGHDAWTEDDIRYNNVTYEDYLACEKAEFKVTDYVLDIKIRRELVAVVKVMVDRSDLETYDFTLYSGYRVKCVTADDGTPLDFSQAGDYVTVKRGSSETSSFQFEYEGCCKRFYTTQQGVFLPGYFAYYPQPGRSVIYFNSATGYEGYSIDGLGYTANFEGHIDVNLPVYSNIQPNSAGDFSGNSDGLMILASRFAKEEDIDGCRVIYPVLDYECELLDNDEFRELIHKYENTSSSIQGMTVFVPPAINCELYGFGKDYLMGDLFSLPSEYSDFVENDTRYSIIPEDELEELQKELKDLQEKGENSDD